MGYQGLWVMASMGYKEFDCSLLWHAPFPRTDATSFSRANVDERPDFRARRQERTKQGLEEIPGRCVNGRSRNSCKLLRTDGSKSGAPIGVDDAETWRR